MLAMWRTATVPESCLLPFIHLPLFFLLGLVVLGLLLGLIGRLCLRRAGRRYQARLRQLEERELVAFALHDTLLQSMQGVLLRVQSVGQRLPGGSAERDTIEAILDQADEVLAEGRHQVLALRMPLVPGDQISQALASLGQSLQASFDTPFRMILTARPLPLDGDFSDEIYRIGREALYNAFQHAQAGHIELELVYGCEWFSLFVRDDGRGIDADPARHANYRGLAGMRERAERIGGSIEVLSMPERGTEVILKVPAEVAYSQAAASRWRRLHYRVSAWLGRIDSQG